MTTRKTRQKRSRGSRALLESLAELERVVREGLTLEDIKKRFPTRVRVIAPDPGKYSPAEIKALRTKIGISQADFASLMGVSHILVQSWEQGVRDPSPLARRLLDTISSDPAAWIADLRRQAKLRRVG